MGNYLSEPITTKINTMCNFDGIQVSSCSMQGWRITMEDEILIHKFENNPGYYLFGVFDGHAGNICSVFLKENLVKSLEEHVLFKELKDNQQENVLINSLFTDVFRNLDNHFYELYSKFDNVNDGTTANLIFITPSNIHCINLGDSRSILVRNKNTWVNSDGIIYFNELSDVTPYATKTEHFNLPSNFHMQLKNERVACDNSTIECIALSEDHKPDNFLESKRIMEAGGIIRQKYASHPKTQISLATSRSFGDHMLKQQKLKSPDIISNIPDIKSVERTENDNFIFVACDGIWDVFSNLEVCNFISNNNTTDVLEKLFDESLIRSSKDNMSAILIKF